MNGKMKQDGAHLMTFSVKFTWLAQKVQRIALALLNKNSLIKLKRHFAEKMFPASMTISRLPDGHAQMEKMDASVSGTLKNGGNAMLE